jgi:anti-sigma regulatory factor (Ser/Thr protein kinase)
VLAVNELTTNTIVHTPGSGTLGIWSEPQTVVCEIRDSGFIADAFAGRHSPTDSADHGRGLWMANQLCDLVQIRSNNSGTTIRLHVDRLAG